MDVVERFLGAMAAHDWEAMAGCITDDVVRNGPYHDVYEGREDYVRFISELLPALPGYAMALHRVTYAGAVALAELSETVDVDGAPLRTDEALVFDLTGDGRIRRIDIFLKSR
jgi:ketosteroid isomerase-like protein